MEDDNVADNVDVTFSFDSSLSLSATDFTTSNAMTQAVIPTPMTDQGKLYNPLSTLIRISIPL